MAVLAALVPRFIEGGGVRKVCRFEAELRKAAWGLCWGTLQWLQRRRARRWAMIRLTELVRLKLEDAHAPQPRERFRRDGVAVQRGKHEMPRLWDLNRDFRRF